MGRVMRTRDLFEHKTTRWGRTTHTCFFCRAKVGDTAETWEAHARGHEAAGDLEQRGQDAEGPIWRPVFGRPTADVLHREAP